MRGTLVVVTAYPAAGPLVRTVLVGQVLDDLLLDGLLAHDLACLCATTACLAATRPVSSVPPSGGNTDNVNINLFYIN